MGRVWVGTSGFSYAHWRGVLYPEGLASSRWLERYAEWFDTVELNATFYRLPTPKAVDAWRKRTPDSFRFAVKGSRYLTHMKRLTGTGAALRRFFDLVERLEEKLGPVLWQLPPQMSQVDLGRLERFLERLPRRHHHAFEFRHPAWYTLEVARLLGAYDVSFCEHDLISQPAPALLTDRRYLRFHGHSAAYTGRYGPARLEPVARKLLAWKQRGKSAYVYFNNDTAGHAVFDALTLKGLLDPASITRAARGPAPPPTLPA